MPIWLRKFTTEKIREQYEKEAEAQQEAMEKASGVQRASAPVTSRVEILQAVQNATYNTKVAKK